MISEAEIHKYVLPVTTTTNSYDDEIMETVFWIDAAVSSVCVCVIFVMLLGLVVGFGCLSMRSRFMMSSKYQRRPRNRLSTLHLCW
mmetsp:Transcript_61396/g.68695  ORF Transcript_61396/g.68695 Transcript_61396/m.68695 type:complete len:86 (-) Transcript_61396:245-502(-)